MIILGGFMDIIKIYDLPRVKIGWSYYSKLLDFLKDKDLAIVYLTSSKELLVTSDQIIEALKILDIPFEYTEPCNSLRYLKERA